MSASKALTACRRERNKGRVSLLRVLVLALSLPGAAASAQHLSVLDAAVGRALFERIWVTAPASTATADGLGPYYDARSCAACHPAGGAGAVPDNLTVVLDDPVYGRQLQRKAVTGLPAEAVVHFSVAPDTTSGGSVALQRTIATLEKLAHGPVTAGFSLRRPPSLAGVARFAEVSAATLQALEDPLDSDGDGISGRMAGRYGWQAGADTLEEQIAQAFSLDIGLSNPLFPANSADCTAAQHVCLAHSANTATGPAVEVEQQVLDLVAQYLTALPAPPAPADDPVGQQLFTDFGCAACHVPELPTATLPLQAWTDLLLHDLGPGLAVGSNDAASAVSLAQHSSSAPIATSGDATASEWRTAPLWGLGQRQGYLHDGRARTLEEAILWHGGEATASRQKFAKAAEDQRQRLQVYLLGL